MQNHGTRWVGLSNNNSMELFIRRFLALDLRKMLDGWMASFFYNITSIIPTNLRGG